MTVFLSYNRRDFTSLAGDQSLLARIKARVEASLGEGCVFHDESNLSAGGDWKSQIDRALNNAVVLVLLAGKRFFDDEQMERLAEPESVIKRELITAHKRVSCTIVPVSLGGLPPHRSGRSWPAELGWLSGLQWLHLDEKSTDTNLEIIVREICRVLAGEKMAHLSRSKSVSNDLGILCGLTSELRKATLSAIASSSSELGNPRKYSLLALGRSIGEYSAHDLENAKNCTDVFMHVGPEIRAILLLRSLGPNPGRDCLKELGKFDDMLRPISEKRGPEALLKRFVLLNVQRAREMIDDINLGVTQKLVVFHQEVKRLPPAEQKRFRVILDSLVSGDICLRPEDKAAFRGHGNLSSKAKRVLRTRGGGHSKPRQKKSGGSKLTNSRSVGRGKKRR